MIEEQAQVARDWNLALEIVGDLEVLGSDLFAAFEDAIFIPDVKMPEDLIDKLLRARTVLKTLYKEIKELS